MFLTRIAALPSTENFISNFPKKLKLKLKLKKEKKKAMAGEIVLELVKIGAELKPLSGIAGDAIGGEESSDDRRNSGAVLLQPISLQNSTTTRSRGIRTRALIRVWG